MAGEPILIVDDNVHSLKLARVLLTVGGYDVRTAPDAPSALQVLETFAPRLILMDVQMPGMSGVELTRLLKAEPAFEGAVIVALTAYAMNGDRQKLLDAGYDAYVAKPLDTQAFPTIVASLLAGRD